MSLVGLGTLGKLVVDQGMRVRSKVDLTNSHDVVVPEGTEFVVTLIPYGHGTEARGPVGLEFVNWLLKLESQVGTAYLTQEHALGLLEEVQ